MKRFPTACLLALLTTTAFAEPTVYKAGELSIVDPWTQELPPGAPTAAVYFELRNQGLEDDTLTGVDTPIAGIAELHRPISQDGMMKMGQMQGVTIPAGGHATFAPMGFHAMLMDLIPDSPLRAGQQFELTLHFAKAGDFVVKVPVLSQPPAEAAVTEHAH